MTSDAAGAAFGYPSRWFLSRALPAFAKALPDLAVFAERPARWMAARQKTLNIELFVNEDVHPDFYAQLKKIRAAGVDVKLYADQLTVPRETKTGEGNLYSVFTPFKNAVWDGFCAVRPLPQARFSGIRLFDARHLPGERLPSHDERALLAAFSERERLLLGGRVPLSIHELALPARDLEEWYVSEAQAWGRFEAFLDGRLHDYHESRDALADERGTSRLSLALTWGLVSARQLVAGLHRRLGSIGAQAYVSELVWREFYKYLYFHRPELETRPFQVRAEQIHWETPRVAEPRFRAWAKGETGYPLVDAAMRQLAVTGWMHNRARMVVSSVFAKHLGIDWRWGQDYFRAMLIDLDEASNIGGWQWGASVGADPKPIRIFNPSLQAERYDPNGAYQARWLTEAYRAHPPTPLIPHPEARAQALRRYGLAR